MYKEYNKTSRQATGWSGCDEPCTEIASVRYLLNGRGVRVSSGIAVDLSTNERSAVAFRFCNRSVQPPHQRLDGLSNRAGYSRPTSSNLGWTATKNVKRYWVSNNELVQPRLTLLSKVGRQKLAQGARFERFVQPSNLKASRIHMRARIRKRSYLCCLGIKGWTVGRVRKIPTLSFGSRYLYQHRKFYV